MGKKHFYHHKDREAGQASQNTAEAAQKNESRTQSASRNQNGNKNQNNGNKNKGQNQNGGRARSADYGVSSHRLILEQISSINLLLNMSEEEDSETTPQEVKAYEKKLRSLYEQMWEADKKGR